MALVKKDKAENVKEEVETKASVSAQDKLADAQAKIEKAKEAGATAGEAAPEVEKKAQAPAKATGTAVGKPVGKVNLIFQDKKDVLVAPFSVFPRIKTGSGNLTDGELNYGTWVDIEVLSHNLLYVITPNSGSDDEEAKEHVRYSYDNKTIDGSGEDVQAYIAELKEMGYDKATSKQYMEIVGVLLDAEKSRSVEDNLGQMIQLQLSPTSGKKFTGFIMSTSFHVSRGTLTEEDAAMIRVTATAASSKTLNWTLMKFALKPTE